MIKVSIVIPVYNVEKYLEECLDTILNQSFVQYEVICVEDCSKDGSKDILKCYMKKYDHLKVLYNEQNMGAANCRNKGLAHAEGEYVLFLDADDFFHKQLLENVYAECKANDLDICIYDYIKYNDKEKKVYDRFKLSPMIERKLKDKVFGMHETGDELLPVWQCALWTRMLKRSFVLESGILFQSLHNANDVFFSYTTLANARRIKYVTWDEPLLYYRTNIDHQLSNSRSKSPYCIYEALKAVVDYYSRYYPQYMKQGFYSCIVLHIANSMRSVDAEQKYKLAQFYREQGFMELGILDAMRKQYLSGSYLSYIKHMETIQAPEQLQEMSQGDMEAVMFHDVEKTRQLRELIEKSQWRSALWGVGKLGKLFLEQCEKESFSLNYLIDADIDKHGTRVGNYEIASFASCKEKIDVVFVTNIRWMQEILEELSKCKNEIVLVDLYSFYGLGVDLQDCIYSSKK